MLEGLSHEQLVTPPGYVDLPWPHQTEKILKSMVIYSYISCQDWEGETKKSFFGLMPGNLHSEDAFPCMFI